MRILHQHLLNNFFLIFLGVGVYLAVNIFLTPATSSQVAICGNNIKEGTEQCDGLSGQSCISLGFSSGSIGCTRNCILDTSQCPGSVSLPPVNPPPPPPTQCNDGIDNSDPEDALIDMNDPGCSSPTDNDETNTVVVGGNYVCTRIIPTGTTGILGAQSGDVICFQRGRTYSGIRVVSGSSNFTIGATGLGVNPVLDGGGATSVINVSGTGVKIDDVTVRNAIFGVDISDAGNTITIENVESYNNTHGMRLGEGSGHTVRNCYVHNNSQNGIVFGAKDVTIANCIIENNSTKSTKWNGLYHGIYASDGCANATLSGNTIAGINDGNGVNFKCKSGTISNNVIENTGNAIHLEDQCSDPDEIPINGKCSTRTFGTVTITGNTLKNNEGGIVLYDYDWNTDVTVNMLNNTTIDNKNSKSPEPEREIDVQVTSAKIIIKNNIFDGSVCSGSCFKSVTQSLLKFDSGGNCMQSNNTNDLNTWRAATLDATSIFAPPTDSRCVSKGAQ